MQATISEKIYAFSVRKLSVHGTRCHLPAINVVEAFSVNSFKMDNWSKDVELHRVS